MDSESGSDSELDLEEDKEVRKRRLENTKQKKGGTQSKKNKSDAKNAKNGKNKGENKAKAKES